jgi:hypothetical protein
MYKFELSCAIYLFSVSCAINFKTTKNKGRILFWQEEGSGKST